MIVLASWLVAAFGLVCAGLGLLRSCGLAVSLSMMLDLWVAAGLLRLSADSTSSAIFAAGALILVRKLVMFSLDAAGARPSPARSRSKTQSGDEATPRR